MPTVRRELGAFLAAATVPAALPATAGPIIFLFSFPIALLHVALLAIPAYYLLRRRFALTAGRVLLASFLIGAIPIFLFVAPLFPPPPNVDNWAGVGSWDDWLNVAATAAVFGLLGTSGGLPFWLILRNEADDPGPA
jgi:hypothetical protein